MKQTKQTAYWCELIYELTRKEVKVRYKSSLLGYMWSLANPLFFGGIYYYVFHKVMKVPFENYPLFLVSGLFSWQWISASITNAGAVFLSNAVIIRRVAFPREALPVSIVLMEGLHFLCAIPVILFFVFDAGHTPALNWIWGIPLLWLLQVGFLTGICWIAAVITPFLRDMERFISLGLMAAFYATPVLYPPNMVPQSWKWVLNFNPAASLTQAWRHLLIDGSLTMHEILMILTFTTVSLIAGFSIFKWTSPRLAEVL